MRRCYLAHGTDPLGVADEGRRANPLFIVYGCFNIY